MELFATLEPEEKNKLLKFPAYISLLAANHDGQFDDREKQVAIDLAMVKEYQDREPKLVRFYTEVAEVFERNIEQLDRELPKGRVERETAIRQEMVELEMILGKLGNAYIETFNESMQSFKNKVSKAHENVLEHFIFPFPIKGFTDIK